MRQYIRCGMIYLFLLLLLSTSSFAASNADKPFLWRVTSQNATVYLLGSLHAATIDMYPLPDALYTAFDKSNYLVVEIDINKVDAQTQLSAIKKYGMYLDGSHIDPYLQEIITEATSLPQKTSDS